MVPGKFVGDRCVRFGVVSLKMEITYLRVSLFRVLASEERVAELAKHFG
jgi:hypothetical protein